MIDTAALATALAAGFLGSAHCFGMCAGISGLFAVQLQLRDAARRATVALAYNAGRLITYSLLGALVALAGQSLARPDEIAGLSKTLRIVTGLLIVLIGLHIAVGSSLLPWLERSGAWLWQRVAPLTRRLLPITSLPRATALGLIWGLLPCGLVYSVLLIAAVSGGPVQGGATMLAFGLGTLPAMLLTGLSAQRFATFARRKSVRRGAGVVLIALGVLTVAQPLLAMTSSGGDAHHHHALLLD